MTTEANSPGYVEKRQILRLVRVVAALLFLAFIGLAVLVFLEFRNGAVLNTTMDEMARHDQEVVDLVVELHSASFELARLDSGILHSEEPGEIVDEMLGRTSRFVVMFEPMILDQIPAIEQIVSDDRLGIRPRLRSVVANLAANRTKMQDLTDSLTRYRKDLAVVRRFGERVLELQRVILGDMRLLLDALHQMRSLSRAELTVRMAERRTYAQTLSQVSALGLIAPVGLLLLLLVLERKLKSATELALNELETQVAQRTREVSDTNRTLKRREKDLKRAQRLTHTGSWVLDVAADKLEWSEETYAIFGMDPAKFESTMEAFVETVHPDDRAYVQEQYEKAVQNDEIYNVEHRIVRRDTGEVRWVRELGDHERDAEGKVVRSHGAVQDITEQKRGEEYRATNEQRLRMLLDLNKEASSLNDAELLERSLDIAVAITHSKIGYLHLVNDDQQTLSLSTWNREARRFCTAAFDDHYPIEKAGIWADSIRKRRVVVHNDYLNEEAKKGYPDGHFAVHRHMSAPVMDDDKIRMVIGVGNKAEPYDDYDAAQLQLAANDVSRFFMRRMAELQLERKTELLERSNADLQQFAYVSSHDLREPLRSISSYLQLLERKYGDQLNDEAREFIGFAVIGAQRLDVLIHDLLEYSRVETLGQSFAPVSMDDVAAAAVAQLDSAIRESGAKVTVDALPDTLGDKSQLVQLLQNLIANAIKYTDAKTVPEIRIAAEERDGETVYTVQDNGIGIAPQYFERIFVIFQRLHGRDEYSGTGIGLAVCKRIIERHSGRIWVESGNGAGSTFLFTLNAEVDEA